MKSELNYNNDISLYKLCERCKRAQATLNCSQCSPLQNFCNKCDIVVHSLPSKISHIRNSLNTLNVKDDDIANIIKVIITQGNMMLILGDKRDAYSQLENNGFRKIKIGDFFLWRNY